MSWKSTAATEPSGSKKQVVGPAVAVDHRRRLGRPGRRAGRAWRRSTAGPTSWIAGGTSSSLAELLPALREHHREHGLVDLVAEADRDAPLGELQRLAPPGGVPRGQAVDGLLGVGDLHARHLVDHSEVAEVLHHEHELRSSRGRPWSGGRSGPATGAWLGQLRRRTHASRRYMRSTVDVNTASSASAGSFTTTVCGHPEPVRRTRYSALHHPDADADLLDRRPPARRGRWPPPARPA